MKAILEKLGALGALVSAAACPACFPLLAAAGSALGLGILAPWEGYALYALQGFVMLSLVGNVLSFRVHRKRALLALGIFASAAVLLAVHVWFSPVLIYIGLLGLAGAAVGNAVARKRCASRHQLLESAITCPRCGFQKKETMPTDACQFFHECPRCQVLLKPKPGDCCVFCSYGPVKCPPRQEEVTCRTC